MTFRLKKRSFPLELGVQWSNIAEASSDVSDDITMLNVFLMLLADTVIYTLFTVYMDQVNPGIYGVRKPLYFPFKRMFKVNFSE